MRPDQPSPGRAAAARMASPRARPAGGRAAARDCSHMLEIGDAQRNARDRKRLRGCPELSAVVAAPAPNSSVGHQSQVVPIAGRDPNDLVQAPDPGRVGNARAAHVGKLSVGIVSPSPDVAGRVEREAVESARRDGHDIMEPEDLDRPAEAVKRVVQRFGPRIACRSMTELPVLSEAPGPDRAIALQGEDMRAPGRDRDDIRKPCDEQRLGARVALPVTQLPGVIVTPCPDRAVRFQGGAEAAPGRDGDDAAQTA